jgi:hypothetical protein
MPFSSTKHKGFVSNYTGNGVHCAGAFQYFQITDPTGTIDPITGTVQILDIATQIGFYSSDDAGANYSEIVVNKGNLAFSANNATLSNITVWGTDSILTQGRGDGRYFPLSTNATIISGTSNIPGSIHLFGDGNGTSNPRVNYGITRKTDIPSVYGGNSTTTSYLGVSAAGIALGSPLYGIHNATPNRTDGVAFTQSDLSVNSIFTTAKFANNTIYGQSYILCDYQRISFGFYSSTAFSDMYFDADGAQFFCIIKATNNASPTSMEVLTRGAADALYEKIARRN